MNAMTKLARLLDNFRDEIIDELEEFSCPFCDKGPYKNIGALKTHMGNYNAGMRRCFSQAILRRVLPSDTPVVYTEGFGIEYLEEDELVARGIEAVVQRMVKSSAIIHHDYSPTT